MIPPFDPSGLLPAGEHEATWVEVMSALGFSSRRKRLLKGLLEACRDLATRGATHLFIDGSFATQKVYPGDYDCCYDNTNMDFDGLPAVFHDFSDARRAQKKKYGGEFFPSTHIALVRPWPFPSEPYRTFFSHDKDGNPKGVVVLDLGSLPND